ncbi:hypothetical protein JZO81_22775 [Enterococcus hulanensis]|uniref:SpaA isopeptide-forming pilin-related protein n=1 Tax=Enterococcus TaxID=1350 RepID=UPI000B5A5308|nr:MULTISPECIES: SpaA isopeptide-forming pilin-related protein [Enterococcus]MBO0413867.1 hypothetical protein [Enterococcus hulanensis]OTO21869.1 hypothetical protein A5875_003251 [Enterococcus sp. 3H8_DIV0648]
MRKQIKIKQLVAILLPIVFILGIVYSISSMISLRADDSSTQLIVQKGDEDITGKDIDISNTLVDLKMTAKVNQLYRLPKNEKLSVFSTDFDSENISTRTISSSDFDVKEELATLNSSNASDEDKKKLASEFIQVSDSATGEVTTYLKLLKGDSQKISFARENTSDEFLIEFENIEDKSKQKLFSFISPKIDTEPDESEVQKEAEENKEFTENKIEAAETKPLTGNESIEELEKRNYSEKESFKPIELPLDESKPTKKTKATRAAASINVTGAKLTVRSGTAGFDASDAPGYDKDDLNDWVRTFDSNIYLLTFSLEGSDPGITYSNIKYRVDMDLPNAYGFDTSGKNRNNFTIVTDESNGLKTESDGTKTENGYVESTINSNGQILLPIFVNVLGAQHNTKIIPELKITIVSAVNDKTGIEEKLNKVYDKEKLPVLSVPEKKVSAKASLTTSLHKGDQESFGNTVFGGTWPPNSRENWQVGGVGVGIMLKPISGRNNYDFRGATFPVGKISFTINTPRNYYKLSPSSDAPEYPVASGTNGSDPTKAYPINIIAGTTGSLSTNASDWHWNKYSSSLGTLNINEKNLARSIPFGKTGANYHEVPTVSDKSKIGVYDTGDVYVADYTEVEIDNYEPIWNPYTYNMDGTPVDKNKKYFASVSLLVDWSNLYFSKMTESVKYYYSDLEISNLTYESESHAGEGKTTFSVSSSESGISQFLLWVNPNDGLSQGKDIETNTERWITSGGGKIAKGYQFDLAARYRDGYFKGYKSKKLVAYARWNANSAKYDASRETFITQNSGYFEYQYGIKKTTNPAPDRSSLTESAIDAQYTWHADIDTALKAGEISALKITSERTNPTIMFEYSISLPVVATGPINSDSDSTGNRNIAMYNTFGHFVKTDGTVETHSYPGSGDVYEPTVFDNKGNVVTTHRGKLNGVTHTNNTSNIGSYGDSFWIKGVGITTTTKPEKDIYKTDEKVRWKVTGNVSGGNGDHTVTLKTTIPKGLSYVSGSKEITDGTLKSENVVTNGDGSTTITWVIENVNASKHVPEVTFETKADVTKLTFTDSSISEVTAYTVGEIFVTGSPNENDDSPNFARESSGKVQLYQMQKISLEKSVSPENIEVGYIDDANSSASTDIKYKIKLTNNSSDKLVNVRVLDVLPYNGDSLGTDFTGNYSVTGMRFIQGNGKVTYTNSRPPDAENRDPNSITGWGAYVPGTSNVSTIKNAQAFLIALDEMAVEEELEFEINISPTGQKAGDIYRNRASFNSSIDLPVKSNTVETKVFSRDLTGYVWYDDDYDGLIGNKSDGSPEDPVGNIPVKLYRTSYENGSYTKQLVEKSLTGQDFVDGNNDSLIKTGSDGKYKFENLPEGEYIAEFMVEDIVVTKKIVIITKKKVGSDDTLNSKADPNTFKTDGYDQPKLNDLPLAPLLGTDKIHHITDVNAGLTRLSKIRLFKYEEGTVIDVDKDGKLSDEEIEASTTNALEGAEFQLYKGKSDDPNTIKDENKVGTVKVTDEHGWLEFESLPPGFYTIVETKAPAGFELLKKPIEVEVPTYNYIAIVHVPDSAQTKLPFTGSTKAMRIILIAAAILMVVGMTGVFLHFRPINVKGGK